MGAGLVTIASPPDALATNAAHLTAIMLKPFSGTQALARLFEDRRRNVVLIGPGCGMGEATRNLVAAVLGAGPAAVLDADALTSFAGAPQTLAGAISAEPTRAVVLTPHEGEFARLFGGLPGSKLARARGGQAKRSNRRPQGARYRHRRPRRPRRDQRERPLARHRRVRDVLAGFVTGLLAQSMPAFEAACAAVWLHGACANAFGPGLIAEDLPGCCRVLRRLGTV